MFVLVLHLNGPAQRTEIRNAMLQVQQVVPIVVHSLRLTPLNLRASEPANRS